MASGKKGNGVQDSSSVGAKIKPAGQGYDSGYAPGQGKKGGSSISSSDTYASIAATKPTKGSEAAYQTGHSRRITTHAAHYGTGKNPSGSLGGKSK